MAGVKGRSGSGGARPGAGRPPRIPVMLFVPPPAPAPGTKPPPKKDTVAGTPAPVPAHEDPKVFLLALMNNQDADIKTRAEAAKVLMPFIHAKPGEIGKKDERKEAAKKAGAGKFAPGSAPKLIVNNR